MYFLLAIAATVLVLQSASAMPETCNGLSNLCNVPVTDVNFAMVHNAMSVTELGFNLAANHFKDPFVDALDAGYRGLSLDICICGGELKFCHGNDVTLCSTGKLDPISTLVEINEWIIANPNNVIIISLQISDFAGEIPLQDIDALVKSDELDGFYDRFYDYFPIDSTNPWPTLAELIESNKQILFFYFKGPEGNGPRFPGFNYWFGLLEATDFSWETPEEIESTLIPNCPTTRGQTSTKDFFLIEAFVTEKIFGIQFQPSRNSARVINTADFAGPIMDACANVHGKASIFSVDFWSEGDLPALIQQRNALIEGPPPPPTESSSPSSQPSTLPSQMVFSSAPSESPSHLPSTLTEPGLPSQIPSSNPTVLDSQTSIIPSSSPSDLAETSPMSQAPSSSPLKMDIPSASPSDEESSMLPSASPSDSNETISSSSPTVDGNETQNPSEINGEGVCTVELDDGEVVLIPEGESYGPYFSTLCGSTADFECFCNTKLPGKIECPFCTFSTDNGDVFCAATNETISFLDGTIRKTCSCEVPSNPLEDQISVCEEEDTSSFAPSAGPTATPDTSSDAPSSNPSSAPFPVASAVGPTSGSSPTSSFISCFLCIGLLAFACF